MAQRGARYNFIACTTEQGASGTHLTVDRTASRVQKTAQISALTPKCPDHPRVKPQRPAIRAFLSTVAGISQPNAAAFRYINLL
jgi:hypothetical protein